MNYRSTLLGSRVLFLLSKDLRKEGVVTPQRCCGDCCMLSLEVNDTVFLEQQQVLEQALSTNPKTQKALQKLIRQVIREARKQVVASEKFKNGDPRGARQAVRTTVYKKNLGANINIYNSRKAHGHTNYEPPRKGVSGRGGNRRPRSARTAQIMGYDALDRGFILRWLNEGAKERSIKFKANDKRKEDKWNKHPNTGTRGNIAPRYWFRSSAERALVQATDNLANLIDTELMNILNKKK